MKTKQLIAFFILVIYSQPMIITSDDRSYHETVVNQVQREIETLQCCGFDCGIDGDCDGSPTALACPFIVVGNLMCIPCCACCFMHNCYTPYRINQIKRADRERERMNQIVAQELAASATERPTNNTSPVTAQPIRGLKGAYISMTATKIEDKNQS